MNRKKITSKILAGILSLSLFITALPSVDAHADSFKSVTLGADLSKEQKEEMLKYFNVTKNDANVLEVTSQEEYKYLGKVASASQLGNRSISCSYVEPTTKGGLDISTNNITWVTEGMIRNSLITAGVENAIVKASAPFKVSGTAALTGILKGFENSSAGEKIDEDKKEAANEELVVTGDLGDKIGQDDATNLINDVKKEIIKKKPDTKKEIDKIVDKTTKDYKEQLSDEDIKQIKALMTKINDLDLDYNNLKDQLNDVTEQLKDKLTNEEAQNFFNKVKSFFSNLWDSIKDFFSNLFGGDDTSDTDKTDEPINKDEPVENTENIETPNTEEEKSSTEIKEQLKDSEKVDDKVESTEKETLDKDTSNNSIDTTNKENNIDKNQKEDSSVNNKVDSTTTETPAQPSENNTNSNN